MTWEPIVKENKLYGLSLNPLGKKAFIPGQLYLQSVQWQQEHLAAWNLAESQRRLVEVDRSIYKRVSEDEFMFVEDNDLSFLKLTDTFTADESNGKLINLKVI